MPWFQFRKRHDEPAAAEAAPAPAPESPGTAHNTLGTALPPHLQRIVEERGRERTARKAATADERLATMQRQRLAMLYDIEQGELAASGDNPWQHRIELLTEALGTVQDDLRAVAEVPPSPWHPLPPTPVTGIDVSIENDLASIAFNVSGQHFAFAEERDWSERGHQLARPELEQIAGDPAALVPEDTPADLREPLALHLRESLYVFAADLRDVTLDGEPLPQHPTLADMGKPCPACGGWTDWRGRCEACTIRKARQQELKREETRLLSERAQEAEERHRLVERLPISRRRLADLDAEIAALERSLGER
jgi:hypothetical protein